LLGIVLSADESLPSLDLEACESHIFENGSLTSLLRAAYKEKSFSDLVENPLVRVLANQTEDTTMAPGPLTKNDGNQLEGFQVAFGVPYQGDLPQHFIDTLNMYSRRSKGSSKLYNKTISIIQSSGMGKSRLVHEVANQVFTIPANLREELPEGSKAYPPSDGKLRSYFGNHELKSDDLLQAEYAILLKHIFILAASEVSVAIKGREGSVASAWADHLKKGQSDDEVGIYRQKFYTKAVDEAYKVSLLKLYVDSPTIENRPQETSGIFKQAGRYFVLKEPKKRLAKLFGEMRWSAGAMIRAVTSKGSDEASTPEDYEQMDACFVYFDEAHNLIKPPEIVEGIRYRNPFHNLGTVLSELCDLPIFFIFLSTNSRLQQVAPLPGFHPSARYFPGTFLMPPFTELSFDVFMTETLKKLQQSNRASLANACTTKVMSSMGRPLWFAHHEQWKTQERSGTMPLVDHVLQFAGEKLAAQHTPGHVSQSELAALSARIGITFDPTTRASREMESQQVESHMRVVYAMPEHQEYMRTGSSSEPVLAEVAAGYLNGIHKGAGIAIEGPRILLDNCKKGFLAGGEWGELCGRLLMTVAHDIAVPRTAGKIQPFPKDPWVHFHRPIPVLAFLRALFADDHHDTVLKATPITNLDGKPMLEDAFKNAFVCFSHFALAGDSEMLEAKSLRTALFRGMAMQADNQVPIDAVIPIHMGPIKSPITTETTSAINLLFKNRKHSYPCSVDRSVTVPDPHQAVISIVLELGEKQSKLPLVEAHHWDLPETQSDISVPHYDDNHYSFIARGCGPETYRAVPEEAKKSYDAILASGGLKDDFPRVYIGTSWALVGELEPKDRPWGSKATSRKRKSMTGNTLPDEP
ncbi:hypothetical protein FRC11_011643, partial [Ceratobasidium sp. 423]